MSNEERLTTLQFFAPSFQEIDFQLSKTLNGEESHLSLMYSTSLQKLPSIQKQLNRHPNQLPHSQIHRPRSSFNNKQMKGDENHQKHHGYRIMTKKKKSQIQNQLKLDLNFKVYNQKNSLKKKSSKDSICSRTPKAVRTQRTPIKECKNTLQIQKMLQVFGLGSKKARNSFKIVEPLQKEKFELKLIRIKDKPSTMERKEKRRIKVL